jgi:hypothetical protein
MIRIRMIFLHPPFCAKNNGHGADRGRKTRNPSDPWGRVVKKAAFPASFHAPEFWGITTGILATFRPGGGEGMERKDKDSEEARGGRHLAPGGCKEVGEGGDGWGDEDDSGMTTADGVSNRCDVGGGGGKLTSWR